MPSILLVDTACDVHVETNLANCCVVFAELEQVSSNWQRSRDFEYATDLRDVGRGEEL